jgi:hypothetical protein
MDTNDYYKRVYEYNTEVQARMYIFEITKFCGYSTLIYMYKNETMADLYNRISYHFGCKNIKGLYIESYLYKNNSCISDVNKNQNNQKCGCLDKTDKYILIPISSLTRISEFIFENTAKEPRNLEPIYPLPLPVVYRIYLDDGHCHEN